ncbi:MAG: GWxTD domain-containing protein, partial [Calditrichia bacterium]
QFQIELPHVKNFYTSPLLFVHPVKKFAAGSSRFYLQPSPLIEYWDFNTPLGIRLNAWYSQPDSPLKISLSVLNVADPQIHFIKDTLLTVRKREKSLSILLPSQLFPEGKYQINVKYEIDGQIYDQIAPLGIVWFDKPFSLWNLSTTIGPMKYLMDEKDYKYLTKGGKEAQLKKFSAYWKEQDPTPDTPFNELQNEFYTRVDSAIIKFGGRGLSGWKTDIGRIYILYGAPDEIEDRSLAPVEKPYLRWTYYIDDKQMKVTFYATDGRRNYKLANIEEMPLQ